MREIEVKFENMSLECFHGNLRPKLPQGSDTNTHVDDPSSGKGVLGNLVSRVGWSGTRREIPFDWVGCMRIGGLNLQVDA